MKVLIHNDMDIIKAVRKLSKLKSISGVTSAIVKQSMIFKKGTTIRREKILQKHATIRAFKMSQKKGMQP